MSWSPAAFAVARWQFTLVLVGLAVALGLIAASGIPRSEDPIFPLPDISVRVVLPGVDPAELEATVIRPLERAIATIEDIDEITAATTDGAVIVNARFEWGTDPERKYDEVVREVNAIRAELPASISHLEVHRTRITNVAIMQIGLVSDTMPMRELEKRALRLSERLNQVQGVREAKIWAAPPSEVSVQLDTERLARLQITPAAVAEALARAGAEPAVGALEAGPRRFSLKVPGGFRDLTAIQDLAIRASGERLVRVRDVAEVRWAQPEPTHLARLNGRRAVFVAVLQKDAADAIGVTRRVQEVLRSFEKDLPANVRLDVPFQQSKNISHRLNQLFRDLGIAVGLVALTLSPLGLRAALIVMASIPTSLVLAILAFDRLGFTINQLSIAGFILALGLLVDDSIVVTENITRRLRGGEPPHVAAARGAAELGWPVIGCTAALMLAFLPLAALPEASGAFIRSLPVAVLCAVGASLIVSVTVIPALASKLLPRSGATDMNVALRALNTGIRRVYSPLLDRALRRPWLALGLLGVLCALAIPLLGSVGLSLFPGAERPQFAITIEGPQGTTMARTDSVLRRVEAVLAKEAQIDWYASNLGRGNPQIYYNFPQHLPDPSYAELFVQLHEWRNGPSEQYLEDLEAKLQAIPGARIAVLAFHNGSEPGRPLQLEILGPDPQVLRSLAARAEEIIAATPGVRAVYNPSRHLRTDLHMVVDDSKASVLGVAAGEIRRVAHTAFAGEDVGRFHDADGDDYPVRLRLAMNDVDGASRNLTASLDRLYVPTLQGGAVPLSAVASFELRSGPGQLTRRNQMRTVAVAADVRPGADAAAMARQAVASLKRQITLPPGYRWSLEGEAAAQAKSLTGLLTSIIAALLGIMAVLVLEFGRFRTALAVAGIIPFGVFGAVVALWLSGYPMSFTAMVGIIALIGIEMKNSILLVDAIEKRMQQGASLVEAVKDAGELRFLPVLLTSATAICGLIPLALEGSGLYSPLAIAIIGGLISSTLLARVATPLMYFLIWRNRPDAAARTRPSHLQAA